MAKHAAATAGEKGQRMSRWEERFDAMVDAVHACTNAADGREQHQEIADACLGFAANIAVAHQRARPVASAAEAKAAWLRKCEEEWERTQLFVAEMEAEQRAEALESTRLVHCPGGNA